VDYRLRLTQMGWLIAFGLAFAPAMLAQLRGHHAAGTIILLDVGAVVVGLYLFIGPGTPLMLAPIAAWLGAFLWSLGR
jgi:hypothetical protein